MGLRLRGMGAGIAVLAAMALATGAGAAETAVRVNVFPILSNLGLYAAQAQGFFAKRGLKVRVEVTSSSQARRDGLAKGSFEIAHIAVDNAVAMVELASVDAVIVMDGDNGLNELYVQPNIRSYADLRGRTTVVDAPNTAYALLLYKMLQVNGLQRGEYLVKSLGATRFRFEGMQKDKTYAASMLVPPYTVMAEREGFRSLGPAVRTVGPYQAIGAVVLRRWAQANADTLMRYIQGYLEGLRWAMNSTKKREAVALVAERLKLNPDVAAGSYAAAADPVNGFARDAKFDAEGFKNVLKLRAELEGQWAGTPPPPEKYLDLSYYERAMAGL